MITFEILDKFQTAFEASHCGSVAKELDDEIVVCEFKLQLGYYVPFQTNIIGKGMNLLIPPPSIN